MDHLDLAYGLEGSPASKITPIPPGSRGMLRRGYTTQTDYRDSEAQTDPATLGYYDMATIYIYIYIINLSSFGYSLSNLYFYKYYRLCV